eukprot:5089887-Heterocapsa_arctica.AAC.1
MKRCCCRRPRLYFSSISFTRIRGSIAAPIVLELRVDLGAELGVAQHPLRVVLVAVVELHLVASCRLLILPGRRIANHRYFTGALANRWKAGQ